MSTHRNEERRNLGIDLLRAVAMFFVICQHLVGQAGLLEAAAPNTGKYWVLSGIQVLVYCAVNIYGITTGYLLCRKKFRLSRIAHLWLTTVFWSVAVSCCFFVLVPETRTLEEIISMFFPILRGRYWFFTAYFVVMLISPALNVLISVLSKQQFRMLLCALFLIFGVIPVGSLGYDVLRISTGHHFAWMAVLYLIGGYLSVCEQKQETTSRKYLSGYFLFAGVHLLYKFAVVQIGLPEFRDLLLTYPSPLILGEAVCLFHFFRKKGCGLSPNGIVGRVIAFVTPGIYAVYVIHVHPMVFWSSELIAWFRKWDDRSCLSVLGVMLLTAVVIFFGCVVLDAGRQWLFRKLGINRAIENISDWAERKMRHCLAE